MLTYAGLSIQTSEEVLGRGRLRSPGFTDEENRLLNFHHLFQYPGGAGRVHRMD
jgi:hypothetical protein